MTISLRRSPLTAVLAASTLLALAGCTGVTYAETQVPRPPSPTVAAPGTASPPTCTNATQSFDPLPSLPASAAITDPRTRAIIKRGHLVVGVSSDSYLLGARNPFTGKIEGFDIDIAKAVAKSLFGDENKVQLRVITAADRLPLLEDDSVDMVARNMTMTCDRWERINFSAEYYASGQKVLVTKTSTAQTLQDLKGQRVCAPVDTTTLAKLESVGGTIPVTANNHTGCLVLFQQGKADAITGDDTVLAGLVAQDPYAKVTKAPAITAEPYGLGFNQDAVYLTRYANTVLDNLKADGQWKKIYNTWFAGPLGPAPAPPKSVYGRP
ncbi:MAG: glutamate ABC transporter substrate-binding protein [Dermatophilaceae bacterium]